ncbi:MAG: hypothetical protein KAS48_05315 [Gammaproteobacteria bacterium]|nr:hypothetical protein [Gammaproteobacteria bacterium]
MKIFKYISVSLLFFLMACDETDKAPAEKIVKDDHIMSGYMKTLEKAEEVQKKADEAVERRDKEIEEATGKK